MQGELDLDYPALAIRILGVNEAGAEFGNGAVTAGRDIPWLQDVDADGTPGSDVGSAWDITFRDVVILNGKNEWVETYNLQSHNLAVPKDYEALRKILVDIAKIPEPTGLALVAIISAGLLSRVGFRLRKSRIGSRVQDTGPSTTERHCC